MFRVRKNILPVLLAVCILCVASCTLFRPLPLDPVKKDEITQKVEKTSLSKFNGNYQIMSNDSVSGALDYVFTYKSGFNGKKFPGANDYINLAVVDDRHIKATLFVNNKMEKAKTVKGNLSNNHFTFHSNHFSWEYLFIIYSKQTNRIALTNEDDLCMDQNSGGAGILVILPVFGASSDSYNLRFKKIRL